MKKIVRLTESDIAILVKKIVNESEAERYKLEFEEKLREGLDYAGEDAENLYLYLINKVDEWVEFDKYDRA